MGEDSKYPNRKKAPFKRKYQKSLNYEFIAIGVSQFSHLVCIICGAWLPKEAMKPSKLFCPVETKYPALKDKSLEFFKREKICEYKEQKQQM